ncbi:MAG: ABC transporter substrate-binding protein, partial [Anaerovoracaceae bacterium]|nr:ABC transporter substrate-binding protein [Anaerovoracaceae bacterium]
MPIKRLFVFILMLTLCAGISGCDGGFMGGGDETAQTERSADLYFPMERVRTLNPVSGMDEDCYNISKLIYQGLFALGTDAVPYPQLAESAEYSEDGEKITVVLRKGIKWSDGNDFTASDVKFSYDAHMGLSRSGASLYTPYLQGIQS